MIIKTQALYPGSQGYSLLRVRGLDVEMCVCVCVEQQTESVLGNRLTHVVGTKAIIISSNYI